MALIVCSECGKEFSDKAPACPNCGCPTECIVESAETGNEQEKVVEENITLHKLLYGDNGSAKVSFKEAWQQAKEENKELIKTKRAEDERLKKEAEQEYKRNKAQNIAMCPKCHSTSITYTDKKLSLGRAIVGNAIAGGVGAVLGGQSSKKGKCKCLKCGHTWKI